MKFEEAYKILVERSVERNTKEIPTILSCVDFENKECLEIGAGPLGRIALKLASFAKHITCLEKESDNIINIKANAEYLGLDKKVSAIYYPGLDKEKFPFKENNFDIVYCAWLPNKTTTDTKFLEELTRITRKHIIILMPGIKGDEPRLISLVKKDEKARRQTYQNKISKFLKSSGFEVEIKEGILRLEFLNEQEIREVYHCMAFKNELDEKQKKKVNNFLDKRIKTFKDGFYIVHATKKEQIVKPKEIPIKIEPKPAPILSKIETPITLSKEPIITLSNIEHSSKK
jgi:ubiquinone/menaquinone biosynthesis C-methylase UbiE